MTIHTAHHNPNWEMFTEPAGLAAAKRQVTVGDTAVRRYGEAIWDAMTFHETFTKAAIAEELVEEFDLTLGTARQYVQAFMAYARAVPESFSGPCSRVTRIGRALYTLKDNPER